MKQWALFLISITMLILSCSPFSKELIRQVDEIRPFREIQGSPENYLKRNVLWGGVIIETTSRKDETLIKVIQTGLDLERRPQDIDISGGRFLVRYPGFLDPDIYEKGREITVIGEITGKEVLSLGEISYVYPVVVPKDIHLWAKRSDAINCPPCWNYYPFWRYGYP
jgi:outer membrane lipoprotein